MTELTSFLEFVAKWPTLGALAVALAANFFQARLMSTIWLALKEEREARNKTQAERLEDWKVPLLANTKAGDAQALAMGALVEEYRLLRQEVATRTNRRAS